MIIMVGDDDNIKNDKNNICKKIHNLPGFCR
jgi:hypothetical protein